MRGFEVGAAVTVLLIAASFNAVESDQSILIQEFLIPWILPAVVPFCFALSCWRASRGQSYISTLRGFAKGEADWRDTAISVAIAEVLFCATLAVTNDIVWYQELGRLIIPACLAIIASDRIGQFFYSYAPAKASIIFRLIMAAGVSAMFVYILKTVLEHFATGRTEENTLDSSQLTMLISSVAASWRALRGQSMVSTLLRRKSGESTTLDTIFSTTIACIALNVCMGRDVFYGRLSSSNVFPVYAVLSLAIVLCDQFGQMLYYPPDPKTKKTCIATPKQIGTNREMAGSEPNALESYLMTLRNSLNFTGRSSRREFWTFLLVNAPINLLFQVSSPESTFAMPAVVWTMAIVIPTLAVSVRRLHDIGSTGWWLAPVIVGQMIPVGGGLLVIALLGALLRKGIDGENRYGPPPSTPGPLVRTSSDGDSTPKNDQT